MKVVEKPLKIGSLTFANFEEFAGYVKAHQLPKREVLKRIRERLKHFEEEYDMSSEAFYRDIAGTPAEDEPAYLEWKMEYETYLEMISEEVG